MKNEKNIFTQAMENFVQGEENAIENAYRLGNRYYEDMKASLYQELSKEELQAFLKDAYSWQNSDGMIRLYNDDYIPSDARHDMWYKPTYAVAVASIFSMVKYPEIFDIELKSKFNKLLEIAFKHGIVAHGYESREYMDSLLLELGKANTKRFLELHSGFCNTFTESLKFYLKQVSKIADSDEPHIDSYDWSSKPINVTAKRIMAAWNGYNAAIFVYGTLKKDEMACELLKDAKFAGDFSVNGYKIVDLGCYPGVIESENDKVIGEVYFVNNEIMKTVDEYESNGKLYIRKKAIAKNSFGEIDVDIYVYNQFTEEDKI